MRILILDDVVLRHEAIRDKFSNIEIDSAYSIDEAKSLASSFKYDVMFLDHDLEIDHYILQSGDYVSRVIANTGADFANWLVENNLCPKQVIVHSMNPVGANNIKLILEEHSVVQVIPFFKLCPNQDPILY